MSIISKLAETIVVIVVWLFTVIIGLFRFTATVLLCLGTTVIDVWVKK